MVRQFRPGLNALEKKVSEMLGSAVRIRLQVARTYEAGLLDLVKGRVDFARFGPASYVMAKRREPTISILAVESNGGTKEFHGIIAVHRDSPIVDLKQLRGRSFAFGDDSSTIGRYLAQLLLLENGIVAGTLGRFEYLGRHDRVGAAVGLGQFEAGALKDSTFAELVDKGSPIRELARFPNATKPWIARGGLARRLHDVLSRGLLALRDPMALDALGKDGFLRGADSDYDRIRRALERNEEFFASRQSSDASWEEGAEAQLASGRP
jgi:phosphonate transport system substrate-binding protein